ncbi:MAG TPA: DEAD/DEAH box helicase, partial [Methanocorpusculum sp.]|nr:DEAD/DEAH box helicase [Methanocorpusculum sp.]
MSSIISPYKKGYKIYFCDDSKNGKIKHIGTVQLEKTTKGIRPSEFFVRRPGATHSQKTPTKELILVLRANGNIQLTTNLPQLQQFLIEMQLSWELISVCRMCLIDDKITFISKTDSIKSNNEYICIDCAKRELKREFSHIGGISDHTKKHIELLLTELRDLDKVLSIIYPKDLNGSDTIFDRLESSPPINTSQIDSLPLPRKFIDTCNVKTLTPVQQLAVDAGLLFGKDLLVVSATASGKTFIGELAGLKNYLEGYGRLLFIVPLVALANQKYDRFFKKYSKISTISLMVGVSRINIPENRHVANRGATGNIIVGTYEGIDNLLRKGETIRNIGTVVIDEVQMLEDPDRGHRLDGLISRLKYIAP